MLAQACLVQQSARTYLIIFFDHHPARKRANGSFQHTHMSVEHFRIQAFLAKQPHDDLLDGIATAIIVKRDAALGGIADYARRPQDFGVELGGRRWSA